MNSWLAGKEVVTAAPARFARLGGASLVAAQTAGKHLFLDFSSGLSLHTHLGMHGSWHLYRPGERWQRPERAASIVLRFAESVAVCFDASRLELVRGRSAVAHLGPDVLAPGFDAALAAARARAVGSPSVGEALLDQRAAAGIGNVYRCEVLWMHRISPWRPLSDCGDDELTALYRTAREVMAANSARSAPRRFPHGRAAVHGRGGRPCPRCGGPVRVGRLGDPPRYAYWCPRCQPD